MKIHTYRNTSIRTENDEIPRSMQCIDSFTQGFMTNMNSLYVNLSLSDDIDSSLHESYTSSSSSSFSYAQPLTPCSDSSRRPSVASEDWALQYSASLSAHSQRHTPPSTPCTGPASLPLGRMTIDSEMRDMSSSTGAPYWDDYLSASGLLHQGNETKRSEYFAQEPQPQHWYHSNEPKETPWNQHEPFVMPRSCEIDMEAVDMTGVLVSPPFEGGAINIRYQSVYGEELTGELQPPLTVVPSQTFTLPCFPQPTLADLYQKADETQSISSPERSHPPDSTAKANCMTINTESNTPSLRRNRRAPKKATKRETYRIGFIDCRVEPSKKHKCTWTSKEGKKCEFATTRHEHLKRHKDIHKCKIEVVCPKCGHHFAGGRKDNLLSHIWNTHWRDASSEEAGRRDRMKEPEARRLGVWEDISRREAKEKEKERVKKEKEKREKKEEEERGKLEWRE